MRQELIFAPMGALALLTFLILILVPVRRTRAVSAGVVKPTDFKHGESAKVPGYVSVPNRLYMNLLELPVLFYVACLMFFVVHGVDRWVMILAWAFVALRLLHALIYLTFNPVGTRAIVFGIGNLPVLALWILFFARLFPHGFGDAFSFG